MWWLVGCGGRVVCGMVVIWGLFLVCWVFVGIGLVGVDDCVCVVGLWW